MLVFYVTMWHAWKHRVTIPCKWSFEIRISFHEILGHSPLPAPPKLKSFCWNIWFYKVLGGFQNMSFCVMIKYRSFFRKTKHQSFKWTRCRNIETMNFKLNRNIIVTSVSEWTLSTRVTLCVLRPDWSSFTRWTSSTQPASFEEAIPVWLEIFAIFEWLSAISYLNTDAVYFHHVYPNKCKYKFSINLLNWSTFSQRFTLTE